MDRRSALGRVSAGSLLAAITTTPPAYARNLPTSNGADTSKVGTAEALVPILKLRNDLKQLEKTLQEEHFNTQQQSAPLLSKPQQQPSSSTTFVASKFPTREADFKRLFDSYSDQVSYKQKFMDQNAFLVYYTQGYDGPGRQRMEEGNVENERQTLQFGARNEAWVAWESFLAEYEYYQKTIQGSSAAEEEGESFDELSKYLSETVHAVERYLALAPRQDMFDAEKQAS
ncbi:MAG: hypothetical protein SGILL_008351 [Bacillariaceae sp.]